MSKYDVIDDLENRFLDTSDWRLEKAVDYPNDKRNLEAAENLERLAATVGDVDPRLCAVFEEELAKDLDGGGTLDHMLRLVGFHDHFATASDFVLAFILRQRGSRHRGDEPELRRSLMRELTGRLDRPATKRAEGD